MIDLHCHILPAICDGSPDINTSLEMAKIAVNDGITVQACTPHIYPGIYENNTGNIQVAMEVFQSILDVQSIALKLVIGADVHMVPEVIEGLKKGGIPTLNNSRYFLLEPSHYVPVPRFIDQIKSFISAGYIPIITHPERLHWLNDKSYHKFILAVKLGAWIQITAGAIEGRFGAQARYWAYKFLKEGVVHIIATDAHNIKYRSPVLSKALLLIKKIMGEEEADRLVNERAQAVLDNLNVRDVVMPVAFQGGGRKIYFREKIGFSLKRMLNFSSV
jgi:protein-tyrosine phosphatase